MRYTGAVFFDYDGTLSDEKEGIYYPSKITVKTINEIREKGYFVCLATGRSKCYAPPCGMLFDGYITSNGAYAEVCGEPVHRQAFNFVTLNEIMTYLDKRGIYYSADTQERCYAKDKNEESFKSMIENFNIPKEIYYPIDGIEIGKIYKLLISYRTEEIYEDMVKAFAGRIRFDKHRFFKSTDASFVGVSKASGVRAVLRNINVPFENTYAFGDGTNDIEMLRSVKHAVAMGISADAVKEVAEYVTDSVVNEGVYKGLKHYGII